MVVFEAIVPYLLYLKIRLDCWTVRLARPQGFEPLNHEGNDALPPRHQATLLQLGSIANLDLKLASRQPKPSSLGAAGMLGTRDQNQRQCTSDIVIATPVMLSFSADSGF